jgi:hypothetical protein
MDQKVSLRADAAVLRGELLESKIFAEANRIREEFYAETPNILITVGRLMSDSSEDLKDPKVPFNTHSLLLEPTSGINASKTRRFRLHVAEVPEYILYVGQIVGVIGRVTGSRDLHAERIICGAPVPEVDLLSNPTQSQSVHVSIASGPYSPENMLIFDSIGELEARIRNTNPPDYLIVMGPFLDINHPAVATGTIQDSFERPATFDDIYREEIVPKLNRLARTCESTKTELIIVPATNEARYLLPLPQPAWNYFQKDLPASVTFASNPSTIDIGGLQFLVTSTDALSAINANVLFKQNPNDPNSLNRVESCLAQILKSRALFPVMPSSLRIDPARRHLTDIIDDSNFPHVIVTPSLSGKRFVKKLSNRIFVNPGFMSDASGTQSSIVELVINPGANNLYERINGEPVLL